MHLLVTNVQKNSRLSQNFSASISGTSACAYEISAFVVRLHLLGEGAKNTISQASPHSVVAGVCVCTFLPLFKLPHRNFCVALRRPCGDTFQVLSFPTLRRLLFTRNETLLPARVITQMEKIHKAKPLQVTKSYFPRIFPRAVFFIPARAAMKTRTQLAERNNIQNEIVMMIMMTHDNGCSR